MKPICCLLAIGLFGCLAGAQWQPKFPPVQQRPAQTQNPIPPQNPQPPKKPQLPSPPQKPQPKPQTPQKPQKPATPPGQVPQGPQTPQVKDTFHTCEVAANYKIQCGAPGISASECGAISCCFDGHTCYYGKFVTLQCTKDGQFIVVVARDATLPNLDLDSISFYGGDDNCGPVASSSAFAIYQFPVTACGTVMTEEPGEIVYENRMSSSYEVLLGPYGAITRDSHFDLSIQCRYIGTTVEAFVVEVGTVPAPLPVAAPGPLRVELRLGSGQCTAKGCDEAQAAYTSFYGDSDYPLRKVLRDPVYVGVHMLERTDPNIVLTLGRCWATADPYPHSLPQWDLLVDGCPYRDDRYQTMLIPIDGTLGLEYPTHHKHFMFKMFTFVSAGSSNPIKKSPTGPDGMTPLNENVYIHCETSVCQPSLSHNCDPRCFRKRREIAGSQKKAYREVTAVASSKLLVFSAEVAE